MYGNDTEWENGFQRTLRKLLLKILSRLHQSQHAARKGLISAQKSSKTVFPDFIDQSYNMALLKDGKPKVSLGGNWAQPCYCGVVLVARFIRDMARDRLETGWLPLNHISVCPSDQLDTSVTSITASAIISWENIKTAIESTETVCHTDTPKSHQLVSFSF